MNVLKANKQDDIEFINEILLEDVIPNIVTRVRDTTTNSMVLTVFSLIIALAMFVIGIISIVKIGWLIGIFMIFFSILVVILSILITKIIDLSLNNHMFLTVMYKNMEKIKRNKW